MKFGYNEAGERNKTAATVGTGNDEFDSFFDPKVVLRHVENGITKDVPISEIITWGDRLDVIEKEMNKLEAQIDAVLKEVGLEGRE